MRLGIDVGGTFTDLVLIDDAKNRIFSTKELTTPSDLAEGVLRGIERILAMAGIPMDAVDYIGHGTTIGTNALIERSGAKVGLITTDGFRDVLEIARIERPDGGLYDMNVDLPEPLVPRYLRLEVAERIGADGQVVHELDEASALRAAEKLRAEDVESAAICLLFAFRNPAHERRVREICEEILPGTPITISSEIAPEFREFERTSTTVLNAYLLPITANYIDSLLLRLQERYGKTDLRIMQASGGSMSAQAAKARAVQMVNSGPAGGALAAGLVGRLVEEERVIGVDMGGTSFDVSLIVGGEPRLRSEGEFEGYPVKVPLIDVEGIGAGGGSIAWIDAGGALNVGPRSAGADPGPACYGLGGTLPTVTDANLVLGRLNPDNFLGGEMRLDVEAARRALQEHVAAPLGLSVEEAAVGVVRVVNANMERGISVKSTQKGYDVREFSLLAFGGAGPLHAVELAEGLGMARVIIPPYCSVFSAFGVVASDLRHDYVRTMVRSQAELKADDLQRGFDALEAIARRQLAEEQVAEADLQLLRSADVRYEGQSYELNIALPGHGELTAAEIERLVQDFHETHQRLYVYSDPDEPIEVVNLRLAAVGRVPRVQLMGSTTAGEGAPQPTTARRVVFPGRGSLETAIYDRHRLAPGASFHGPALIEERTSTTVIPPDWSVSVHASGALMVKHSETATAPEQEVRAAIGEGAEG